MAKNIEMNYYNGSSYDVLYPKNTWANIENVPNIPSVPVSIANGGTGGTTANAGMKNLIDKLPQETASDLNYDRFQFATLNTWTNEAQKVKWLDMLKITQNYYSLATTYVSFNTWVDCGVSSDDLDDANVSPYFFRFNGSNYAYCTFKMQFKTYNGANNTSTKTVQLNLNEAGSEGTSGIIFPGGINHSYSSILYQDTSGNMVSAPLWRTYSISLYIENTHFSSGGGYFYLMALKR